MAGIVEIDRRSEERKERSLRLREGEDLLDRQLEMALDGWRKAWESGFVAAMDLVARQQEELVLARGTREFAHEEDTAPYPIVNPEEDAE